MSMQTERISDEHQRAKILLNSTPLACRLMKRAGDGKYMLFECNEESVTLFKFKDKYEFMKRYFEIYPEYQPNGKSSLAEGQRLFEEAFAEGRCVSEFVFQTADGEPIPAEVTLVRLEYGDDFIIAGYTRDMREHKLMMETIETRNKLLNQQAAQIQEAHNRTRLLLDTTPLAVHLWDRNLNLFDCNEESVRLFKARDKQDYTNRFREFSPEYQPDGSLSSDMVAFNIRKAIEDGKHVFEWLHLTSDGIPLPSEVTLVRVAYEDDFAIAGYVRDLRVHKEMMNEIHRKSTLLDSVNQAANILLQSEIDEFENNLQLCMGMIGRAVSADRLCIWKNSTKEGKLYCTLIDEWIIDERLSTPGEISFDVPYEGNIPTFEHVLTLGECINSLTRDLSPVEQTRLNKHGIKSIFVAPVFVHDEFWGFVGCDNCHDETVFSEEVATTLRSGSLLIANALLRNEMTMNLQKAAAELKAALMDTQKANNAKSDFLANMSHEMRTPLNAIIGLSDLALESDWIDKDAEDNLEKIYNAGETLLSLVNDILDISKIEAGKFELIMGEYQTPSLINDTVTNNILRIGEKPIEFILNIQDDLPALLYGDELRIKQILSNLLSNAFKYTRQGTVELGINCVREDSSDVVWLTIWVRDSGIGIRTEDVENLFADYTQMDLKINRKIEGTGLGLPIAKKMVELMNGTISVESEYGKGSIFTVRLKQKYVSDETLGPEAVNSLKTFRYSNHKRSKNKFTRIKLPNACILVVDDNATNLDVAKGLMKPYGMRIDAAASGKEAIEAMSVELGRYNAIFMDHMMPGMDGIEATARIRELGTEYAKKIPIIALTANAIAGNEKMFINKGFQDYLTKPIDITRLDAVIRHWLRDKAIEVADRRTAEPTVHTGESKDKNGVSTPKRRFSDYQIDGIDLQAGLDRFGGDREAYQKVLRSYTANTSSLLDSIREVKKKNLNDYAITVHGIKGSSRSICANLVGDIAELLERAAKEGDFGFVSEKNAEFALTVDKLLENLGQMLTKMSAETPKPKKIKPDEDLLAKILEACYTFDMDTVEAAVKELESYEYETNGELISWLWENVQQFNVDEIIRKLTEMNIGADNHER